MRGDCTIKQNQTDPTHKQHKQTQRHSIFNHVMSPHTHFLSCFPECTRPAGILPSEQLPWILITVFLWARERAVRSNIWICKFSRFDIKRGPWHFDLLFYIIAVFQRYRVHIRFGCDRETQRANETEKQRQREREDSLTCLPSCGGMAKPHA